MNNLSISNGLLAKPTIGRSEYGRVKVALAPGKGFMDWLRLTANKTLARRKQQVDHQELVKHNKREDCWIHLLGTVYDVTQYLDFHPGGVPELLRAAGRDATPLFNQYHSWVNYQSMLKACVVGPFNGDLSKLPPCLPPTTSDEPNRLGVPPSLSTIASSSSSTSNLFGSRIEATKNSVKIENPKWSNIEEKNLTVTLVKTKTRIGITSSGDELDEICSKLRILIRFFNNEPAMEYVFDSAPLLNDQEFEISVVKNGVEVIFPKVTSDLSKFLSESNCSIERRPGVSYHEFTISSITRINHDTILFSLNFPKNAHFGMPLGYHVSVKVKRDSAILYRPYTPIMTNSEKREGIDLMIKIYDDGIATPSLQKLKAGDIMEISDPIGKLDFKQLVKNAKDLIILAAGSGITPMIDIIDMKLKCEGHVHLFMFNKTEKDVQTLPEANWILSHWGKQFQNDEKFVIRNVLSKPEKSDGFLHGRISTELLRNELKNCDSTRDRHVFICGPDGFVMSAKKSCEEIGMANQFVHVFQG